MFASSTELAIRHVGIHYCKRRVFSSKLLYRGRLSAKVVETDSVETRLTESYCRPKASFAMLLGNFEREVGQSFGITRKGIVGHFLKRFPLNYFVEKNTFEALRVGYIKVLLIFC